MALRSEKKTASHIPISKSSGFMEISKGSFDAAVSNASEDITYLGVLQWPSTWIKSTFLGRGSYGSVHRATNIYDVNSQPVAIKSSEISRASSLMSEKKILAGLSSPFIVQYYGDVITREESLVGGERTLYNLIIEYCSGGCLSNLVKSNGGGLCEKDVKLLARDILFGLSHIHNSNIVHCDIKPDNILLSPVVSCLRRNSYLAKIGDFGLSLKTGAMEYGDGNVLKRGTQRYMAPELMGHGIVNYGVDVWSFGCTVLEMITGQVAWWEYGDNLTSSDLFFLISESSFVPYIPDWLSTEAKDFLKKCLVKDSSMRWGIEALLNHPFLALAI